MGHKHRADDKRRAGLSDNVKVKTSETTGAGKRVANVFNDRRNNQSSNGKTKRAS